MRVNLKTPSLRTGSFCVKSDFPTFPGSELRLTHTHDESEIVIFILSEAIRSGSLKGIILVKHGELKHDFIYVSFHDSTTMSAKEKRRYECIRIKRT